MKAYELIAKLQTMIQAHGNLDVLLNDDEHGFYTRDVLEFNNDKDKLSNTFSDSEKEQLSKDGYFVI